jgi:deoxyadenosine/deoxycytidine kinase
MALHVAIAGNIGSGKTTLATLLAKQLGFDAAYEDPTNNPYIMDFYRDMQRWSFNLQMYFLDVRLRQAMNIVRGDRNTVQDRTLYEDAEIFAPNLLNMGLMSQRDYDTYRNLFDTAAELLTPPHLMIYLHCPVETLTEQIEARNREYEDSISMAYLERLNTLYDQWYRNYNRGRKLSIDVSTLNFRDNPDHLRHILGLVKAELKELIPG